MSTIEETIEVAAPVRAAYDQWTQFEDFPRFMEGVQEVRQLDDTHLHWRATVAGDSKEWDAEITEQVPEQVIAWRAVGGYRNAGVVHFESLGGERTKIHLLLDHEPQGAAEKIGDWLGLVGRQAKDDLKRFRDLIEARGDAPQGWRGEVGDEGTHGTGAAAGDRITDPTPQQTRIDDPEAGAMGMQSDPMRKGDLGADTARDLTEGPTPETREAIEGDRPRRTGRGEGI
ncbi:MAG: SRPBCC family protein [Thermoleophilia bacterium]